MAGVWWSGAGSIKNPSYMRWFPRWPCDFNQLNVDFPHPFSLGMFKACPLALLSRAPQVGAASRAVKPGVAVPQTSPFYGSFWE